MTAEDLFVQGPAQNRVNKRAVIRQIPFSNICATGSFLSFSYLQGIAKFSLWSESGWISAAKVYVVLMSFRGQG